MATCDEASFGDAEATLLLTTQSKSEVVSRAAKQRQGEVGHGAAKRSKSKVELNSATRSNGMVQFCRAKQSKGTVGQSCSGRSLAAAMDVMRRGAMAEPSLAKQRRSHVMWGRAKHCEATARQCLVLPSPAMEKRS